MRSASGAALSHKAYEHIHRSIVSGLLPQGTVVSEATLARELGVSRTPVGEAIRRLAAEGLVEQIPRYGTVVRQIDRQELVDLYEMRLALECHAAARAAERITPAQLVQLRALCEVIGGIVEEASGRPTTKPDKPHKPDKLNESDQSDDVEVEEGLLQRFLAADVAFHLLIILACGNRRIIKSVQETRSVSRIFTMRRHRHDAGVLAHAHRSHLDILEALEGHDADQARQRMMGHIEVSMRCALAGMDAGATRQPDDMLKSLDLPSDVRRQLEDVEQIVMKN